MPVRLDILESQRLIIAHGQGTVTVADIERYLDDIFVANLLSYAKLVDLSEGEIHLTDDEARTPVRFRRRHVCARPAS